jgi:hypothetical protein
LVKEKDESEVKLPTKEITNDESTMKNENLTVNEKASVDTREEKLPDKNVSNNSVSKTDVTLDKDDKTQSKATATTLEIDEEPEPPIVPKVPSFISTSFGRPLDVVQENLPALQKPLASSKNNTSTEDSTGESSVSINAIGTMRKGEDSALEDRLLTTDNSDKISSVRHSKTGDRGVALQDDFQSQSNLDESRLENEVPFIAHNKKGDRGVALGDYFSPEPDSMEENDDDSQENRSNDSSDPAMPPVDGVTPAKRSSSSSSSLKAHLSLESSKPATVRERFDRVLRRNVWSKTKQHLGNLLRSPVKEETTLLDNTNSKAAVLEVPQTTKRDAPEERASSFLPKLKRLSSPIASDAVIPSSKALTQKITSPLRKGRDTLADKYAILPLPERAFQILVDLNMVELHMNPADPNYNRTNGDKFAPGQRWKDGTPFVSMDR